MQDPRQHSYECMHAPPCYIPYQSPSAQDAMGARWEVMGSHMLPQHPAVHPAVPMSAGPTGCGRTWDGMVAAWESMGAHGRLWVLMGAVMGTVLSQSACYAASLHHSLQHLLSSRRAIILILKAMWTVYHAAAKHFAGPTVTSLVRAGLPSSCLGYLFLFEEPAPLTCSKMTVQGRACCCASHDTDELGNIA